MKLINRIASGTTTVRDADVVKDIIDYNKHVSRMSKIRPIIIFFVGLGLLLLGISIGGLVF